jgi:hypothetical protein
MGEAHHVEERVCALRQTNGNLVRFMAGFAFVEMAVVFSAFLFVSSYRRLQLLDAFREFFMRNDAALAKPLTNDAKQVISKVVEHLNVWCCSGFEGDQHGKVLSLLLAFVASERDAPSVVTTQATTSHAGALF